MDALYPAAPTGHPETIDGITIADVPLAAVLIAAEVVADDVPAPDPDWEAGDEPETGEKDGDDDDDDDWDEDWDDDDWDDEDDEEDEESEDDPDEEEEEDWDDEPPLESRFRVLTDEEKEERIRRKPTIDLSPKRSEKNHPPRGGVRRDASPSRDDEPPD